MTLGGAAQVAAAHCPNETGKTGVMDFGKTCYGEVANLLQTG